MSFSILAGPEITYGLGEQKPPALSLSLEAANRRGRLSGEVSASDKYTGKGWIAKLAGDAKFPGGLSLGAGVTQRNGGEWDKAVPWGRVGIGDERLRLLIEKAIKSRNEELRAELRLNGKVGKILLEPSAFVERFKPTDRPDLPAEYGGGVALRAGWGK